MKKLFLYKWFLCMVLAFQVTLAPAQEAEADPDRLLGGTMSTWVEFATDYVFRGESETNDGEIPSLKAAVTWSHDTGVYVGFYAANNLFPMYNRDPNEKCPSSGTNKGTCDTNNKINAIVGPYVGWSGGIFDTGFSLNSMIFSYHYPDDSTSNYVEMFNTLTLPSFSEVLNVSGLEKFNLNLEYSVTFNEWFGVGGTTDTEADDVMSHYFAFHPSVSLPMDITLSGSYGWQMFTGDGAKPNAAGYDPDWNHWTVAVSKSFIGWTFNLSYHDTDIEIGKNAGYYDGGNNNIVDERIVFAASRSF